MPLSHRDALVIGSPIGPLKITAEKGRISSIELTNSRANSRAKLAAENRPVLARAERQLCEYFAGRRRRFDLPLAQSGTEFQMKVWSELQRIPFGVLQPYSMVAERLGSPRAQRAVGAACGRNQHLIVVPCHRVVAQSGGLGGFSGGLDIKRRLLALEGQAPPI